MVQLPSILYCVHTDLVALLLGASDTLELHVPEGDAELTARLVVLHRARVVQDVPTRLVLHVFHILHQVSGLFLTTK